MGNLKSLEPYLVKNIKKHNSTRPRALQFITPREFQHYNDKVKASDGFDVDNCPGFMCGRIVPINKGSLVWEMAESVADYAAAYYEIQLKHRPLKSVKLIKANKQSVRGIMYYVTFTAVDAAFVEATYRAKVWRTLGPEMLQGRFFEKVVGSEKYVGKKRRTRSSTSVAATSAYFALLRSHREKNARLSFAQARRQCSRLWKDLAETEKILLVRDAERVLKRRKPSAITTGESLISP